jgi:hypothetical protein
VERDALNLDSQSKIEGLEATLKEKDDEISASRKKMKQLEAESRVNVIFFIYFFFFFNFFR